MNCTPLNFMTWNATGIMSSASYLNELLNVHNIDICGISEHWLYPENVCFLETIHVNYDFTATVDNDSSVAFQQRKRKGGVAIVYKKSLAPRIQYLDIDDDRICGIKYRASESEVIFILQVYLPTNQYSVDAYAGYISRLCELYSLYEGDGRVIIMGDFNGHFIGDRYTGLFTSRDRFLNKLITRFELFCITTASSCTGSLYSCFPYGDKHPSLIDHILISSYAKNKIASCTIGLV